MRYIYSRRPNEALIKLACEVDAKILKKFDGMDFWVGAKKVDLKEGDDLINWGETLTKIDGVNVLNAANVERISDPMKFANTIANLNLSVIDTRIYEADFNRAMYGNAEGTKPFYSRKYLGRTKESKDGSDFLVEPTRANIWSMKLTFSEELLVHVFMEKSIKAGVMVPKEGFKQVSTVEKWIEGVKDGEKVYHPWVRTGAAGWEAKYEGVSLNGKARTFAVKVAKALKLDFGVIKVGHSVEGGFLPISAKVAPVMTEELIPSYVRAITKWLNREEVKEEGEVREVKEVKEAPINVVGAMEEVPIMPHPLEQAIADHERIRAVLNQPLAPHVRVPNPNLQQRARQVVENAAARRNALPRANVAINWDDAIRQFGAANFARGLNPPAGAGGGVVVEGAPAAPVILPALDRALVPQEWIRQEVEALFHDEVDEGPF